MGRGVAPAGCDELIELAGEGAVAFEAFGGVAALEEELEGAPVAATLHEGGAFFGDIFFGVGESGVAGSDVAFDADQVGGSGDAVGDVDGAGLGTGLEEELAAGASLGKCGGAAIAEGDGFGELALLEALEQFALANEPPKPLR